jgi:hypothetical protein
MAIRARVGWSTVIANRGRPASAAVMMACPGASVSTREDGSEKPGGPATARMVAESSGGRQPLGQRRGGCDHVREANRAVVSATCTGASTSIRSAAPPTHGVLLDSAVNPDSEYRPDCHESQRSGAAIAP